MDANKFSWGDIDEIAVQLWETTPDKNPLSVSFPDLVDLIMALPNFSGERNKCNEKILEAIQMTWLEEFEA